MQAMHRYRAEAPKSVSLSCPARWRLLESERNFFVLSTVATRRRFTDSTVHDTGNMLCFLQLSEGAQQDPTDFPPQDLLIESPIPSRLPSSVGENQLPSSITTDYPGPSSAASWARAQQAAQNTQNTQNTQITSNTQATQTTQNNAPVQYGYGKPPTYGGGYTGSTVPAPSSGPSPLSENYGPLPPSSRGGVSGYSGAILSAVLFAMRESRSIYSCECVLLLHCTMCSLV